MTTKKYLLAVLAIGLILLAAAPMQAKNSLPDMSGVEGNYDTGDFANSGIVSSPQVTLQSTNPTLTFDEWYEVEDEEPDSYDLRFVVVTRVYSQDDERDGINDMVVLPLTNCPSSSEGWMWKQFSLSSHGFYQGDTVVVSFVFDTRDAAYNDFKGWFVDNVNIDGTIFTFNGTMEGWQSQNLGYEFEGPACTPDSLDGDKKGDEYYQGLGLWRYLYYGDNGQLWYGHLPPSSWSPVSLKPLVDTQLKAAQGLWACITASLPDELSVSAQEHIAAIAGYMENATGISNAVYANGQLAKAVQAMEELMAMLDITCE